MSEVKIHWSKPSKAIGSEAISTHCGKTGFKIAGEYRDSQSSLIKATFRVSEVTCGNCLAAMARMNREEGYRK